MRLRILDLNTPWFWATIFYYRQHYGKPIIEAAIWEPHKWQKWWLHIWQHEKIPVETPMESNPRENPVSARV